MGRAAHDGAAGRNAADRGRGFITEIGPGCPPMAPRVVMAAALEADAVLSLLLGTGPAVEEGPAR